MEMNPDIIVQSIPSNDIIIRRSNMREERDRSDTLRLKPLRVSTKTSRGSTVDHGSLIS